MTTIIILISSSAILAVIQQLYPRSINFAQNKSKKELVIMSVLFFTMVFAFLGFTGVLRDNYHLVDDHEIYVWGQKIKSQGFLKALSNILVNDFNTRYRATYIINRVFQILIIKDNFLIWHILYGTLTSVNLCLLYLYARERRVDIFSSFCFAMAVFVGSSQISVIWRLGPQENLCVLLCMLTIFSLRFYHLKRIKLLLALSIWFTLLLSGIKESALLLLPLLPFLLLYWESENIPEYSLKSFMASLKKNAIYFCSTYIIFFIGIISIVKFIGTNEMGYAGIDSKYSIVDYMKGLYWILSGDIKIYIALALVAIISIFLTNTKSVRTGIRKHTFPLLIFITGIALQFLLHAKSGLYERYLLPSTLIFSMFIFLYCGKYIKYHVPLFAIFSLILFSTTITQREALLYAQDGVNTTALMNKINEVYSPDQKVLVDLGYEKDFSAEAYLQEKYNIATVYNVNHTISGDGHFHDSYLPEASKLPSITLDEADMIVRYKDNSEEILQINNLDWDYTRYEYGRYLLYVKK